MNELNTVTGQPLKENACAVFDKLQSIVVVIINVEIMLACLQMCHLRRYIHTYSYYILWLSIMTNNFLLLF